MLSPAELYDVALAFLEKGGPALWAILLVSFVMWMLIIERYWYLSFTYPLVFKQIKTVWLPYKNSHSAKSQRKRTYLLKQLNMSAGNNLLVINALSHALPLLGLLGTVIGMIQTFDVITVFGNGNARGLAGGISVALLTTMSGLVTALSGLYFSANLNERVRLLLDDAESELD